MAADVVVGGQLARDLVLVVDEMPEAGTRVPCASAGRCSAAKAPTSC
jgi:hypothetical protein